MFIKKFSLKNQVANQVASQVASQVENEHNSKPMNFGVVGALAYPAILAGLISGAGAFAADNSMQDKTNTQVNSGAQNQTTMQNNSQATRDYEFSKADLNNDKKVNWAEIKVNYGASLNIAEWDEDKIFTSFDRDNNTYLDKKEFAQFYSELDEKKGSSDASNMSMQSSVKTDVKNPMTKDLPHRVADDREGMNKDMDQQQTRAITAITASETPPKNSGLTAEEGRAQELMRARDSKSKPGINQQPDIVDVDASAKVGQPIALTDATGRLVVDKKDIVDKEVYNLNGQHIGEVEDLVFNGSRSLQGAVIEVGGFLGIGDRDVFVHVSQLRYDRQANKVVWQSMMSEDELDDLPEYDEDQVSSANGY